jgi:RimJ/RimL family protein N-acetyltransferase
MTSSHRLQEIRFRPLCNLDAEAFATLAADRAIADTMISIPHPLSVERARIWIQERSRTDACCCAFAICDRTSDRLQGYVGIVDISSEHRLGELRFWIGRPYWGRGLAEKAGHAALAHTFDTLQLNRLQAFRIVRNAASGRVLEKLGFRREGLLAQRVLKRSIFENVAVYGLLRQDWNTRDAQSTD